MGLARPRLDGTTFLTGYVVLLFALPSQLVVKPVGASGTPANLLALAGIVWWLWSLAAATEQEPYRLHPTRRAMFLFVFAVSVSYVAATTRAISMTELSTADTGLLLVLGWTGVVIVADGGIPSLDRLETLLGRLALAGGLLAGLGLLQFVTGRAIVDLIQIPGLETNAQVIGVYDRDGYTRPAGTAIHPIEFGVAIAALLPICLHVAIHHRRLSWPRRWLPVVAIVFAIPLSISRSAIVGTLVALAILFPTWERRTRLWAGIAGLAAMAAVFVTVPGMLGTIANLFTRISRDDSALSRTDSYPLAFEFIARSPVIGRGFQTFLPEYRILDNQYLGLLVDTGLLGTLSLLVFFGTAVVVALRSRRHYRAAVTRSSCATLAASVAAGGSCAAFVDALSFPLMAGVVMLCAGLVGTVYAARPPAPSAAAARDGAADQQPLVPVLAGVELDPPDGTGTPAGTVTGSTGSPT
jgi:O-antigen ligase